MRILGGRSRSCLPGLDRRCVERGLSVGGRGLRQAVADGLEEEHDAAGSSTQNRASSQHVILSWPLVARLELVGPNELADIVPSNVVYHVDSLFITREDAKLLVTSSLETSSPQNLGPS